MFNMQMLNKTRDFLQQQAAKGRKFVVIGTYGISLSHPSLLFEPPRDCDLLIPFDLNELSSWIKDLVQNDYQTTLWGKTIEDSIVRAELVGKFYVRATPVGKNSSNKLSQLVIDLTYECPYLSFSESYSKHTIIQGIPVADIQHILRLKAIRNNERDQKILHRYMALTSTQKLPSRALQFCRFV
jgi:hypothetical protein